MNPYILGGALLAGAWFMFRGGSSSTRTGSTTAGRGQGVSTVGAIKLDAEQKANMGIILSSFTAAGYSDGTARAAVVNAYAESALRSDAVGDHGHAVGLFQISDLNGRRDLTGVDRTDPAAACHWLFANEKSGLTRVDFLARAGGAVSLLAAEFCAQIERPADIPGERVRRAALADRLFPPSSSVS